MVNKLFNNNLKREIILILILTMLTSFVSAADISIDMKDSFNTGEKISFNYSISGASENITYIPYINCPNAPLSFIDEINTITPLNKIYNYLIVNENIKSQICSASISIVEPYKLSKNKTFEIITNPTFEFSLNICKDSLCSAKSKFFIKGENIYLNYNSDISELITKGTLTYPYGKTEEINLPTLIKAEQIGTYKIEVEVSKTGYKTISKTEQFGVIESEAKINYTSLDNLNKESENKKYIYFFVIVSVLVVIIAIILFLFFRARQKKESDK